MSEPTDQTGRAARAVRIAVVLITWPFVAISDRLRGVDPPARLRDGFDWVGGAR